jgi:hypothetical protein
MDLGAGFPIDSGAELMGWRSRMASTSRHLGLEVESLSALFGRLVKTQA